MIRTITSAILFLCTLLTASAQGISFEPDLNGALSKARKENKLLFIEYYNSNCTVCKTLDPVFKEAAMGDFYNSNFVSYRMNTENMKKEDSLYIAKSKLQLESVPYFLFFDTEDNLVHCSGAKPDTDYLINGVGKIALNPEERTGSLAKKYNSGDKSVRTLYAYSNLAQLYKDERLTKRLAENLYDAFPKDQLATQKSYTIMKNCVTSIDNGFFTYWANNTDKLKGFEKGAKEGTEIKVLQDILLKTINSDDKKNWNLAKIKSAKELILKTGLSTNPDAFLWQQEAAVLIKEGREPEALALFTKMTEGEEIGGATYIINNFLDIVKDKNSFAAIKAKIDKLRSSTKDNDDKADILYSELLYNQKTNNTGELKKLLPKATDFYKENKLDMARLSVFRSN